MTTPLLLVAMASAAAAASPKHIVFFLIDEYVLASIDAFLRLLASDRCSCRPFLPAPTRRHSYGWGDASYKDNDVGALFAHLRSVHGGEPPPLEGLPPAYAEMRRKAIPPRP